MIRDLKTNVSKNESDETVQNYIDLLLNENQIIPSTIQNIDDDSLDLNKISSKSNLFLNQLDKAHKKSNRNISNFKGIPSWAKDPFSCHLFKVSGLVIGIPSVFIREINSFVLNEKNVFQIENKFNLNLLGEVKFVNLNKECVYFPVIDTANLIIPESYDPSMIDEYKYIIRFNDFNWLLAIDSIGGEIKVNAKDVRWRTDYTRRKWLSGTLIDKMCALIDVDMIDKIMITRKVLED